ncbi:hypothetical protein EC973_003679 [Apophysomyces ossiformis]|uniref:Extradiol ring-cleavage dioxygenase class III enzyme subunit B domain-containing protein n=1 Tax=Apophysomyces ossiformis TaxID=679940 RepID=A0A8H7BJ85_9FUNG|nr:hypothetical protein EC973_003679 [Apophysomyces ossiformis]
MASNPDIPIVEVSTFAHEDLKLHTKLGEALAPLRDQGVVIIGSGSAVHNLRYLRSHDPSILPDYVVEFDKLLEKYATELKGDERKTKANTLDEHPYYRDCHPTAEHLVPFHTAAGAAGEDTGIKLVEEYVSTLSWSSYGFGLAADTKLPNYAS